MIFIYVLFLLSKSMIREIAARGPPGPRADKNADLLEVIKLNLRKNNDDYTDVSVTYNATERTFIPSPAYMRRKNKIEDFKKNNKGVRRANDEVLIESNIMVKMLDLEKHNVAVNNTKIAPQNMFIKDEKLKPINNDIVYKELQIEKTPGRSIPAPTTHMRSFSKIKTNKIEKIKKFYEKNKVLLKQFLSSKIAARTQSTATTKGSQNLPASELPLRQRQKAVKGKGVLSRGQDWLGNEEEETEPPNPDLLDMLPAVGGRIHFRRIEGRLCHRHVIIPEGPKYDSKGRVYLAAHADKVRRPYDVTRRPRLLLPKCCNCCKKSVLGCE